MDDRNRRPTPPSPLPGTLTSRRSSVLLDEVDGRVVVRLKSEVEFVLDDGEDVEHVFDWLGSLRLMPPPPNGSSATEPAQPRSNRRTGA